MRHPSGVPTTGHWKPMTSNGLQSDGVLHQALAFVKAFPLPHARRDWILGEVYIISRKGYETLCLPCGLEHVS